MSTENNLIPPSPQIPVQNLSPLTHFCCTIGNIPTSYMVSLSYEEQVMWLCNYLKNTVIPTLNNNSEAVTELQNLYILLKNYVDNYFQDLDVQEEINNKLDEMVEDGTMQTLINNYIKLNAATIFETVSDMKNSTKLINGSYAQTLGFHNINDNGGALYRITNNGESNEMDVIELTNGLYANLLIENEIIPNKYGAYGDNVHDDTEVLQYILNNTPSDTPIKLIGNHKITTGLISNKPRNIFSDKYQCGITGNTNDYIINFQHTSGEVADYRNNYIRNIMIYQTGSGNALQFTDFGGYIIEMKIENCKLFTPFSNAIGYGLYAQNSLAHCVIYGCNFMGNGIYGEIQDANVIQKNLFFGKGNGIKLDIPFGCLNNIIKDNTIVNYDGNAILIMNGDQITIDNNQIEYQGTTDQTTTKKGMIHITADTINSRKNNHILITNNNLGGGTHLDYLIYINHTNESIIDNNRLVACNQAEIYIGSDCVNTIIRDGNYGVSQTLNPRTDIYKRYIVDDHGSGTMGIWKELSIQNIESRKLKFMKDETGLVHFDITYLQSTTELTLCQLPVRFRPSTSIKTYVFFGGNNTPQVLSISYDGTITIDNIPSAGNISIPLTYRSNKYL